MTTPASTYDYDVATRERMLRKRQPVPGYDPSLYASERLVARAGDGTAVPISLVYRQATASAPGRSRSCSTATAATASRSTRVLAARVSLLDRGVVFAIAHIRGGGDLGPAGTRPAKMAKKKNTFTDFIACAESLDRRRPTTAPQLLRSKAAAPAAC